MVCASVSLWVFASLKMVRFTTALQIGHKSYRTKPKKYILSHLFSIFYVNLGAMGGGTIFHVYLTDLQLQNKMYTYGISFINYWIFFWFIIVYTSVFDNLESVQPS